MLPETSQEVCISVPEGLKATPTLKNHQVSKISSVQRGSDKNLLALNYRIFKYLDSTWSV